MIGAKRYEFRTWATHYRGPLAIHAGGQLHSNGLHQFAISRKKLHDYGVKVDNPRELPRRVVLGQVDLVECVPVEMLGNVNLHCGPFGTGYFALVFDRPRPYDEPIPASGLQGLWNWEVTRAAPAL